MEQYKENENNLNNTADGAETDRNDNNLTQADAVKPEMADQVHQADTGSTGNDTQPLSDGSEPEMADQVYQTDTGSMQNDTQPVSDRAEQTNVYRANENTREYAKATDYQNSENSKMNYNDDGSYTWQNPNPYNSGYTGYTGFEKKPKPKSKPKKTKTKLSGVTVALIGVSSVAFVLFLAVIVMFTSIYVGNEDPVDTGNENNVVDNNNNDTNDQREENLNVPSLETQQPSNDMLTVPQIYTKVKDSVVGIIVTITNGSQIGQGSGTGIILSEDGYIATNAHVVENAAAIKVVLADEREYTAELVGSDTRTDLAVLKIEETGLQPAEFGDSDSLVVGETVVAIGNPYGLELAGTVTSGIVSALNRRIAIENVYMTLIQTDASINPGNSGGPLVNSYGQVIGITSSKIVTTGYEGIGFAIPITSATDIIEELIKYGYIKDRPYIGIQGSDLDATYAQLYDIPQGVYVQYVDPECDAYKQGLKKGDIITAVNGVEITNMAELDEEKNNYKPGDSITLTVYRNAREIQITIILSETTDN